MEDAALTLSRQVVYYKGTQLEASLESLLHETSEKDALTLKPWPELITCPSNLFLELAGITFANALTAVLNCHLVPFPQDIGLCKGSLTGQ